MWAERPCSAFMRCRPFASWRALPWPVRQGFCLKGSVQLLPRLPLREHAPRAAAPAAMKDPRVMPVPLQPTVRTAQTSHAPGRWGPALSQPDTARGQASRPAMAWPGTGRPETARPEAARSETAWAETTLRDAALRDRSVINDVRGTAFPSCDTAWHGVSVAYAVRRGAACPDTVYAGDRRPGVAGPWDALVQAAGFEAAGPAYGAPECGHTEALESDSKWSE